MRKSFASCPPCFMSYKDCFAAGRMLWCSFSRLGFFQKLLYLGPKLVQYVGDLDLFWKKMYFFGRLLTIFSKK